MDQFNQAPAPTKEEFDDLSSTVSSLSDRFAHFGSELKVLRFTGTTDGNGNVYYNGVTPASHVILGATADGDKACTVFLNGDSTGYNYHISSYANWSIGNGIAVAVTVYYVDK